MCCWEHEINRGLMRKLKALGVRLAIDNFGTGCASSSCLRMSVLPTNVLTLQGKFSAREI